MKTSKKAAQLDMLAAAQIMEALEQVFQWQAQRVDIHIELYGRKGERFPVTVSAYRVDEHLPVRLDVRHDKKARDRAQQGLFPGIPAIPPREDKDPPDGGP